MAGAATAKAMQQRYEALYWQEEKRGTLDVLGPSAELQAICLAWNPDHDFNANCYFLCGHCGVAGNHCRCCGLWSRAAPGATTWRDRNIKCAHPQDHNGKDHPKYCGNCRVLGSTCTSCGAWTRSAQAP